jgi:PTS system mannose-specific IIA component
MIGGLIVTHGRLAIELLNAAEMIVGETHHIAAVTLGWHDDVDTAATAIGKALERVQSPDGVVILTDMFGGTPTNIATTLLDPGKIEIVTGVNLPMVIKLAEVGEGAALGAVARQLRDTGQASIHIASDLLAPRKPA